MKKRNRRFPLSLRWICPQEAPLGALAINTRIRREERELGIRY